MRHAPFPPLWNTALPLPRDCYDEGSFTFTLQSHLEDNLLSTESNERIAEYFASISQEFPPLE